MQNLISRNTITFARAVLALSLLLTLVFTPYHDLFPSYHLDKMRIGTMGFMNLNLFLWFETPFLPYVISCLVLIVSILGLYPRYFCILQSWISYSLFYSMLIVEGGDQINVILTFTLIPIAVLDRRKNGWIECCEINKKMNSITKINVWCVHMFIKVQMSLLYFDASVSKIFAPEWTNGTATYYWFNDPLFGTTRILKFFFGFLFNHSITVSLITYGVIALELALFLALFMSQRYKYNLLIIGIIFHFLIFIIHGLPTFFLAMSAGLLLYLARLDLSLSQNIKQIKFQFILNRSWRNLSKTQRYRKLYS